MASSRGVEESRSRRGHLPSREWALGLALLGGSAWLAAVAWRADPRAWELVACQLVAGAVYLLAVWAVVRRPGAVSWRYVLIVGVLCRLILLPTPPLFDDDLHRYVWEGKVVARGGNPFASAPLAPELAPLRDDNWAEIGYAQVSTIYPPLAQYLFALPHLLGVGNAFGLKGLLFLFDLGNMLLLAALLRRLGRPQAWALIYAWSPLASKEFANSGHLEPAMLFFLLLALYLGLTLLRSSWVGLCYGAALSVKLVPLLLAPLVWHRWGWKPLAWAAGVFVLLGLPFAPAGRALLSGSAIYAQYWTFNYSAYGLLLAWEHFLAPYGWPFARVAAAALVIACALRRAGRMRAKKPAAVMTAARDVLAVCLLLSPAVDPWYVCWLLPFLVMAPSAGLLLLTVTCSLSYLYYVNHTFPVWIPLAEYVPVYGMALVEGMRTWRARDEAPPLGSAPAGWVGASGP